MLKIKSLKVEIEGKQILKGVDLEIKNGEVVAIMGPNGSGKSTLAYTLMGHPNYKVKGGEMSLGGDKLNNLKPDERAKKGLFLAFQYPVAVAGVSANSFLRLAYEKIKGKKIAPFEFRKIVKKKAKELKIKPELLERSLNEGFSGGEKKKVEILQMAVLEPKVAILDETDSGLDIDALKIVAKGVNKLRKKNKKMGVMVITHYQRILKELKPDRVVVIKKGRVVKKGGRELVKELEKKGYEGI